MMLRILLVLIASFIATNVARANDQLTSFYSGKSVRLTVGSSAGGGTDIVARILARHMGKYIPGKPPILVVNQPGGGGLVGANRVANTAARDGTEFATMERAIPQLAIMGEPNVHFDPLTLTWLGSLSSYRNDAFMLLVNDANPARTVEDLYLERMKIRARRQPTRVNQLDLCPYREGHPGSECGTYIGLCGNSEDIARNGCRRSRRTTYGHSLGTGQSTSFMGDKSSTPLLYNSPARPAIQFYPTFQLLKSLLKMKLD